MKITVSTPIQETCRVAQIHGMFDLPNEKISTREWSVELSLSERPWNIGLIVGPSGSGKTTIAKSQWGDYVLKSTKFEWPINESLLEAFPQNLSIREIVEILSSVGFSSPPSWVKPFHILSNGEQFRVTLARLLAEAITQPTPGSPLVFDEFTSVVDRTVAQIASAAVAKAIRKKNIQFVAVTCHEDVEEWLQPDWVLRPAEQSFAWRSLRRRPEINLDIIRCSISAWKLFAQHHYLSQSMSHGSVCFLASWKQRPVAFSSWILHCGNGPRTWREHRTVTLPDYQGVGIGNALSDFCASLWKGLGLRAQSTTTHPAMIHSRVKSKNWEMHRPPSMHGKRDKKGKIRHATHRLTAGFTYIGDPANKQFAETFIYG